MLLFHDVFRSIDMMLHDFTHASLLILSYRRPFVDRRKACN
jgi:hypothetical protein